MKISLYYICIFILACFVSKMTCNGGKKNSFDKTIVVYSTKRTCWWNEACKKEFQGNFECKCPKFTFCRGPGKYYNAFCSMTSTGYVWYQRNNHDN